MVLEQFLIIECGKLKPWEIVVYGLCMKHTGHSAKGEKCTMLAKGDETLPENNGFSMFNLVVDFMFIWC